MSFKGLIIFGVACACVIWTFLYQYKVAEFGGFKGVVQSDGMGYYAYLPAIWIEQDLSWEFYFEEGNQEMLRHFDQRFLMDMGGRKLLKTYCGEAILLSPFFIAGSVLGTLRGQQVTGYEPWMQGVVHIAAWFYLLIGIWYWMKFLVMYGVHRRGVFLSVIALVFASNLFHYATVEVTMTHVYSFSMIACFLYVVKRLLETHSLKYGIFSAVSLALIILIRPVNGIVIFILPFLAELHVWKKLIKQKWNFMLASLVLFVSLCSIQPVLNYLQCGILFPWSYGEEGFFWLRPAIMEVLFSFRKGLFIYCPVFFLVVIMLFVGLKKNRRIMLGTIVLGAIVVFLISAWWSWYYGPGFGHRAFIDWYPILFLPLALAVNLVGRITRIGITMIVGCLVVFTLIQTYQYESGIFEKEDISWSGYKYVFMKTSAEFRNVLAGEHELHYLPLGETIADTSMHFDAANSLCRNNFCDYADVFVFDTVHIYGPVFHYRDTRHLLGKRTWFTSRLVVRTLGDDPCRNAVVVFSVEDSIGHPLQYKSMRFRDVPNFNPDFYTYTIEQQIEPVSEPNARVSIYVYNPDGEEFALDDFSVKINAFVRK